MQKQLLDPGATRKKGTVTRFLSMRGPRDRPKSEQSLIHTPNVPIQKTSAPDEAHLDVRVLNGHEIFDNVDLHDIILEIVPSVDANECRLPRSEDSFVIRISSEPGRRHTTFRRRQDSVKGSFMIRRNVHDFIKLDRHLHLCEAEHDWQSGKQKSVSEAMRKFSPLPSLENILEQHSVSGQNHLWQIEQKLASYLEILTETNRTRPVIKCNKLLKWFCLNKQGMQYNSAKKSFNEPGVLQGECIHEYEARCRDELDMKLRDQIIVTRIGRPWETTWWYGKNIGGGEEGDKRTLTVGFFPYDCIKVLSTTIDLENYYMRRTISMAKCMLKPVSNSFGKNVLMLKTQLDAQPKITELKRKRVYKDRLTLRDLIPRGFEYPAVIELCIEYVEKHCIFQGVYRKSCNVKRLAMLNEIFWSDKFPATLNELKNLVGVDKVCVASFVKQLIRDLSEPLVERSLYDAMVELYASSRLQDVVNKKFNKAVEVSFTRGLKTIVNNMEPPHKATFLLLCSHLKRIAEFQETTSMDVENLAKVWSPNVFPHVSCTSENAYDNLTQIHTQNFLLTWIITEVQTIFDINLCFLQNHPRSYSLEPLLR